MEPGNRKGLGAASLNLANIQEQDRGWYNCKVVLLNRQPEKENDVSQSEYLITMSCKTSGSCPVLGTKKYLATFHIEGEIFRNIFLMSRHLSFDYSRSENQ